MVVNIDNLSNPYHFNTDLFQPFKQYNIDGINYRVLVPGVHSEGKYSLIEAVFPAGEEQEVPLHRRSKETAIMYVVEGDFLFKYDNHDIHGNVGTALKFEKEIPLSYKKVGKNEGRLLMLFIPSGFEKFFKDVEALDPITIKRFSNGDPILLQLLEKNYGFRFIFE